MYTRSKATVFRLLLILAAWLFVEMVSILAYRFLDASWFSYATVLNKLTVIGGTTANSPEIRNRSDLRWGDFVEVLHPYIGYVADPRQNRQNWEVSEYGFVHGESVDPITKRSPGKVIVALFGGSFASGVFPSLQAELGRHEAEFGKHFVVLNFAGGGYKQPQQLMILSYLLALGAEFDLVVNIDGFNEVTLPPAENIPHGVNPFYPRRWDVRTAETMTSVKLRRIGRVEVLQEAKVSWAQTFRNYHLYLSPTLCLVWAYRDRRLAREIFEGNQQIGAEKADSRSYTMQGPPYSYRDESELYRDLAAVWQRCSRQMKHLCEANRMPYYHFLQPNLYLEGSKPMSDEERALRIAGDPYEPGIKKGYPVLLRAGKDLDVEKVNFWDLTQIFAGNRETLYLDGCHTNVAGCDIVARRLFEEIQGGFRHEEQKAP